MKDIDFHHASDRRCYWGAPSSDLQRELDSEAEARKELKKHNLSITYFPNGEFYVGFKHFDGRAPEILTPDCPSFESCYHKVVEVVNGTH